MTDVLERLTVALANSYEIEEELGAGGMATVYLAHDVKHDRKVAIKVLRPEFAAAVGAERFLHEIKVTANLQHPHILPLHDSGEAGGFLYYVMPFLAGASLREKLNREKQLSIEETLEITKAVASALDYAHRQEVIHRDIKAENILLQDGVPLIGDFGIALAGGAVDVERLTETGMVVGTPPYMSPEQVTGELQLDGRSDVYSLACVVFEMLAGDPPFTGSTLQVALAEKLRGPISLRAVRDTVPPAVEEAIMQALAWSPVDRFATVAQFAQALTPLPAGTRPRLAIPDEQAVGTLPRVRAHLPEPPTELIGREAEVRAVRDRLETGSLRLLTLTGPGGVGKTRLAIQVARDLRDAFADGVYFVSLADIADERLLQSKIAQTLGTRAASGADLTEEVKLLLEDREVLLVLDNFEQLTESAPFVTELLRGSQRLKVLVTSRAVLHVSGEHEFPVQALSFPDVEKVPPLAELPSYGALRLFVERAVAAKPDFRLTDENARAVVDICGRIDGLPLAIELASSRIKLLTPQALLARLKHRLELLAGGARDMPARQQTMRGAIAWSYDLLSGEQQALFRQVAAFGGGCRIEAAKAVCEPADELATDVLDGLTALVDNSLLRIEEQPDGEPRFIMLQTIREYALDELEASGEATALRKRHAEFFLSMALEIEPHLSEPSPEAWLDRLEIEQDNLGAALRWLTESGETEGGLRLAVALWRFWHMRSYFREGLDRLITLLDLPTSSPTSRVRLKALYAAGVLSDARGDYDSGRRFFEEHLEINRAIGDKWGIANALNNLGIAALRQSDHEAARKLYEESLAFWREIDNPPALALSLNNLGNVAKAQGNFARAQTLYEEGIAIFEEAGDQEGVAQSLSQLGDVARGRGDPETAQAFYQQSLSLLKEVGDKWGAANVLTDLGDLALDQGDPDFAHRLFEESLVLFGELGDRRGLVGSLEGFVGVSALNQQPERALRLAGATEALRETLGAPLTLADRTKLEQRIEPARDAVGQGASSAAWVAGRAMSIEEAITYATAPIG